MATIGWTLARAGDPAVNTTGNVPVFMALNIQK